MHVTYEELKNVAWAFSRNFWKTDLIFIEAIKYELYI